MKSNKPVSRNVSDNLQSQHVKSQESNVVLSVSVNPPFWFRIKYLLTIGWITMPEDESYHIFFRFVILSEMSQQLINELPCSCPHQYCNNFGTL